MPEFSFNKIIPHRFHVDNNKVELVIGYAMIIGHSIMLKLGLTANSRLQALKWGESTLPIKDPISLIFLTYSTSHKMGKVLIHTE